jgi:broad specificity phosphatase PhoE
MVKTTLLMINLKLTMTQTVWIARHGNRLDFVNPDWVIGAEHPYDSPLSDDGIVQAKQLGQRLKKENISHIFASPFLRTVQTANEVAEALDLSIKIESGLSEWLNPEWMLEIPKKLSMEALAARFPRIDMSYTSRIPANYPETEEDILKRAGETAKILAQEFRSDILLIAHGASVLGTTMGLLSATIKPNVNAVLCGLVKMVRNDQEWIMELNGDTSHLKNEDLII